MPTLWDHLQDTLPKNDTPEPVPAAQREFQIWAFSKCVHALLSMKIDELSSSEAPPHSDGCEPIGHGCLAGCPNLERAQDLFKMNQVLRELECTY